MPTRYTQFGAYVGGGWGVAALYMTVRFVESHWFTWVTQMNHIPKDVDYNKQKPWVRQWALWRKYLIIQPLIQLLIQLSI